MTRAEGVYDQLRADIFTARLRPGQRLKFPELCATYETSVGPLREALTKLTSERLVTLQPHLGYTVAALSADELTDLTAVRVDIEGLAFQQAMVNGGDSWESEVVATHHLLALREREIAARGRGDAWFLAHEAFHAALVSGCGNRRLVEITAGLRAETELYRRWAAPLLEEHDRDPAVEHQRLVDAALSRDVERGVGLLRDHIAYTTQMLLRQLLLADPAVTGEG
ncbi:transcriptional regulator [Pseudonocardia sulfidoxydans NBRC 16205]|uniref:Transcriptional regulator n=1 Tax=Pseudonocardia sulfidoxydans NBRC 16205 TaxID=1223511 RepID=A0A511DAD5_9PSEU|nr:transcriptional regulator [Pseudonocardia sulfidoxydans NBRC 16205]